MMRLITLSSGSRGNSILIEGKDTKILIDAGICAREIEKRLTEVGTDPKQINAILITHEHSDHIKGVDVFARKNKCKVYAHKLIWEKLDGCLKNLSKLQKIEFENYEFFINELAIMPFEVMHDAVHTCGFSVITGGRKISVVTDIGKITPKIISALKGSDLVVIESNHDVDMLMTGPYPGYLKRRIISSHGHLSNEECANTIRQLVNYGTKNFVLAHLSETNNTEEAAKLACFHMLEKNQISNRIHISIAYQNKVGTNYILRNKNLGEF